MSIRAALLIGLSLAVAGCGTNDKLEDQMNRFEKTVEREKLGSDTDHWIEMQNMKGEWEKVGLIFGYLGDYDECQNAIAGLKKVNDARNYRCVPAQKD